MNYIWSFFEIIYPLLFIVAFVVIAAIVVFIIINKKHKNSEYYRQTHKSLLALSFDKGSVGEYTLSKSLNKVSGYNKKIYNCYIPKNDGTTTEIDVLMIHEKGIYVFESKNYSGWIFGTETQDYWFQTLKASGGTSQKNKFYNPIKQNETHIKWLMRYLSEMELDISFYSCVVFGDSCELKDITLTSGMHAVVNQSQLYNAVQSHINRVEDLLSPEEIDLIYANLFPLTQKSEVEKRSHVNNVNQIKESYSTKKHFNNTRSVGSMDSKGDGGIEE